MSRSGYIDDNEDPLAHGRWRQAVKRAQRVTDCINKVTVKEENT